jgi:hypothetical protein
VNAFSNVLLGQGAPLRVPCPSDEHLASAEGGGVVRDQLAHGEPAGGDASPRLPRPLGLSPFRYEERSRRLLF